MQVLTEATLRSALPQGSKVFKLSPGMYVTASARRFAEENGITLQAADWEAMSAAPIDKNAPLPYVDAQTGEGRADKPEDMTHLRANLLVPKTHPRIALRGQLDRLEGEIILLQCEAEALDKRALVDQLGEMLTLVRAVLAAEVKDEPLPPFTLWGMDAAALRQASHDVKHSVGIAHPVPDYRMGKLCAQLNLLRTKIRETELCAARALADAPERKDIILTLNRLSSAAYLLFLKEVKDHG